MKKIKNQSELKNYDSEIIFLQNLEGEKEKIAQSILFKDEIEKLFCIIEEKE